MEKRVSVKNNAGDCVGEFSDAPAAFGELDALLLYFHKLSTRVRCARTYLASHIGGQRPETTA